MFDQVMLHSLHFFWYLDCILLVPIRTLCSTCHKLNESLLYVRVRMFQATSVYSASASQLLKLGVSEFCLCFQSHI